MKVIDVQQQTYYSVIIEDEDVEIYLRRYNSTHWEESYGDSWDVVWEMVPLPEKYEAAYQAYVYQIEMVYTHNEYTYVGTTDGLYRRHVQFETWHKQVNNEWRRFSGVKSIEEAYLAYIEE